MSTYNPNEHSLYGPLNAPFITSTFNTYPLTTHYKHRASHPAPIKLSESAQMTCDPSLLLKWIGRINRIVELI
jgi:hypothetical protein